MNDTIQNKNKFKYLFSVFIPPPQWRFVVIVLFGIFTGLCFYVLYISNSLSYLSDKPETCVNCHVMNSYYASWQHGSHAQVTTCNDCHVPQDNFINKYLFKANDGLRHATYFTMRWEPQVIQIKDGGKKAVQENCIRCHSNLIHPVALRSINNATVQDQTQKYCWDCHRQTPHGRVNGLSSTPYARVPSLRHSVPEWIQNFVSEKNN
jgi:cytochrome c nitrite reductase small subunit